MTKEIVLSEWFISQRKLVHPRHGTFFIGQLFAGGTFSASRIYRDPGQRDDLGHEWLPYYLEGNHPTEHATLEAAHAAVERRITELDAANAHEHVEACR